MIEADVNGEGESKTVIIVIVAVVVAGTLMFGAMVLAGVVFLGAQSFETTIGGEGEGLNVRATLESEGIDTGSGTYSCLSFEVLSGNIIWSKYKVTINGVEVNDVGSLNSYPDGSNDGITSAGDISYFTSDVFTGPGRLDIGDSCHVSVTNILESKLIWSMELIVRA